MNGAPSISLALMAWHLAWWRVQGDSLRPSILPVPRDGIGKPGFPFSYASPEYYAVLDRINRGESPQSAFAIDVSPFTEDGRLGGPARAARLKAVVHPTVSGDA